MKITICGSMTFSPEMVEAAKTLRYQGYDVDLPPFTDHYATLASRDQMHIESAQNKIDYDLIRYYYDLIKKSDAILVVNKDKQGVKNYIGANTLIEMAFARILNKPIYLLNPVPQQDSTDEIIAMQPRVLEGDLARIIRE